MAVGHTPEGGAKRQAAKRRKEMKQMNVTQILKKHPVPKPTGEQRNAVIDAERVPHADFRKFYGLNLMVPLSAVMATCRWGGGGPGGCLSTGERIRSLPV